MTPRPDQPQVKEIAAWVQTRVVLRIIVILLAVAALLWVVYKLTAVLLLLVLSIFFAYLVAPLVDLVEKPVSLAAGLSGFRAASRSASFIYFSLPSSAPEFIFWYRSSRRSFLSSSNRRSRTIKTSQTRLVALINTSPTTVCRREW